MTPQLIASMIATGAGVIGLMLALLRHFQESARRRETALRERIDDVKVAAALVSAKHDQLREEVRTQCVYDHQLKELRTEIRTMDGRIESFSDKLTDIAVNMSRLIGRFEAHETQ